MPCGIDWTARWSTTSVPAPCNQLALRMTDEWLKSRQSRLCTPTSLKVNECVADLIPRCCQSHCCNLLKGSDHWSIYHQPPAALPIMQHHNHMQSSSSATEPLWGDLVCLLGMHLGTSIDNAFRDSLCDSRRTLNDYCIYKSTNHKI